MLVFRKLKTYSMQAMRCVAVDEMKVGDVILFCYDKHFFGEETIDCWCKYTEKSIEFPSLFSHTPKRKRRSVLELPPPVVASSSLRLLSTSSLPCERLIYRHPDTCGGQDLSHRFAIDVDFFDQNSIRVENSSVTNFYPLMSDDSVHGDMMDKPSRVDTVRRNVFEVDHRFDDYHSPLFTLVFVAMHFNFAYL